MILAVETSADVCSLAIRDAQGSLVERAFRHRMHLSERLLDDVDALLADAGATLAEIDGLAVGLGPGSFTGVRIGVMTVKTWADILGKPVCGVSALDILAKQNAGHPDVAVVPLIRARPGAVYAALYDRVGDSMRPKSEPEMLDVPGLVERLAADPRSRYLLCGDALDRYRTEIEAALRAAGIDAVLGHADAPRASVLAALAESRMAAGRSDDPLALTPLYLAPPPIDPRAERHGPSALRR